MVSATTLAVYVSHLTRLEHQKIKVGKFMTYAYTTVSSHKLTSDEIKILILGVCIALWSNSKHRVTGVLTKITIPRMHVRQ